MNKTLIRQLVLIAPMVIALGLLLPHRAGADWCCNTTEIVNSNRTLQDNWFKQTGAYPCFRVVTAGVVLNLNGKTVACQNSSGCGSAVEVTQKNVTIKNGTILGDQETDAGWEWVWGISHSSATCWDTIVDDVIIDGAETGVWVGKTLTNSIMKKISDRCAYNDYCMSRNGKTALIENNYCKSDAYGFDRGEAHSDANIRKNYVNAPTGEIWVG